MIAAMWLNLGSAIQHRLMDSIRQAIQHFA